MDHQRITMSDLVLGEALPWDIYDASGHLLLGKGRVISNEQQMETLIERGLFVDARELTPAPVAEAAPPVKEKPSILKLINLCNKRLERLLFHFNDETDVPAKVIEVANAVIYATRLNPDIALACILLNQSAGRYSVRHCVDTAIVALLVAHSMHKPENEVLSIAAAALTMNIGMLQQQEELQNRSNVLSEAEQKTIRAHPLQGVKLLRAAGVSDEAWLTYVLLHHENEDGSGYPLGKASHEIPENAKIISISDRYCARVSSRHYRKSLLPNAALRDILLADKKNIDPTLSACFIKVLGIYPTGTFVRLESGEVGIVTGKGENTTTPAVHVLIGASGSRLAVPVRRDSSKEQYAIREVLREEQVSIKFTMQQLWGNEASP